MAMPVRIFDRGPSVAVLAYEGMSGFETGIVAEVFGLPRPELEVSWYEFRLCAEQPGPIRMVGGGRLSVEHGLDVFASAQTVIVPGVTDVRGDCSAELIDALRLARARGARIVSICSGAFALAAAGLLDHRPATTHWRYAALLRSRFPLVQVDPDVLYVDDGDVLTSAGSAAGLDLCIHLVRRDFGPSIANAVARRLVVPPHRAGGQAQFIEAPVVDTLEDDRITESMEWALTNLHRPITVDTLAHHAHMSTRTYLRQFARRSGTSPIRWLIAQRIQASLPLLEKTSASIEEIASTVGFDSVVTYRHHFARALSTSPSAYRRAFRGAEPGAAPGRRARAAGGTSGAVLRPRHPDAVATS